MFLDLHEAALRSVSQSQKLVHAYEHCSRRGCRYPLDANETPRADSVRKTGSIQFSGISVLNWQPIIFFCHVSVCVMRIERR